MILIADSGSTKTDWRLIDNAKNVHSYATQGLNPYFQTGDEIITTLQKELIAQLGEDGLTPNSFIYFYGAGCEAPAQKLILNNVFEKLFPSATIEVHSDMIAAARATCGNHPGIAAILGTGSNTCYYDGKQRVENVASLGYILGDEGSGAYIGKAFIQAYLNKELPQQLSEKFYAETGLGLNEILEAVYKKPLPNRFLASFTKFIHQNIHEQCIVELVTNCFEQFFDKHVCKYTQHKTIPLSCVGSVAFYFSELLHGVAAKKGVSINKILETPIAGLTDYHLQLSQ